MTASTLARRVLALPYEERERLLAELLDSLRDGDPADAVEDTEWEDAWADEIEARLDQLERGEVTTVSAEQVLAEMRAGVLPARR